MEGTESVNIGMLQDDRLCCRGSTRLEGTESEVIAEIKKNQYQVAEVRPAWRVLKAGATSDFFQGSIGCRGSTRLEGTESFSRLALNADPAWLQRFDPLGGY